MSSSQALTLMGTGITLGCIHVLTGPDHLSALATLSANVRHRSTAFFFGIRWGIGHSTGLLLVGVIFLFISFSTQNDEDSDESIEIPESVTNFFESLVGIFMIGLGIYGIHTALDKNNNGGFVVQPNDLGINYNANNDDDDTLVPYELEEEGNNNSILNNSNHISLRDISNSIMHVHPHENTLFVIPTDPIQTDVDQHVQQHQHQHHWYQKYIKTKQISPRTLALCAGILHGLAGPGGVLGVIPAVQLHDAKLATIYLTCFCCSSTLTMGLFATMYGSCSSALSSNNNNNRNPTRRNRAFIIEMLSASLSILVGITWLILLFLGKLDDVFP